MGNSVDALGWLFIRSIPTIVFVIILVVILERLFFRPVAAVMKWRAGETVGAMSRAREHVKDAESKTAQYEAAMQAARMEIYRQRQAEHTAAVAEREKALQEAREHSEGLVKKAQAAIASEASAVREQLASSSQALAREIAQKVLGGSAEA